MNTDLSELKSFDSDVDVIKLKDIDTDVTKRKSRVSGSVGDFENRKTLT